MTNKPLSRVRGCYSCEPSLAGVCGDTEAAQPPWISRCDCATSVVPVPRPVVRSSTLVIYPAARPRARSPCAGRLCPTGQGAHLVL